MAWTSADVVFADQDREEDALRASPWLYKRDGPPRKPDEGEIRIEESRSKLSLDERMRLNATRVCTLWRTVKRSLSERTSSPAG